VLRMPAVRQGQWRLLECAPAWEGNWTADCFIAFAWEHGEGERIVAAVNYAPNQSQCYARLPFRDLGGSQWQIKDLLGDASYERSGDELASQGLYLDMLPWQAHAFAVRRRSSSS
jgi:hypothetical protein